MFTKQTGICLDGAQRKSSLENSQFIQKVREEDRRDRILEDVFMRSTGENPYHKKVQASIQLCSALKEEIRSNLVLDRRDLVRRKDYADLQLVERQLRAAYVSKAISAQKFEKEALKEELKAKRHVENTGLEEARMRQSEYLAKMEQEVRQKKLALKEDLLEQMSESEAKRQEIKMDIMREKKRIDDAVQKYKEEELQLQREALAKKIKVKNEMQEFVQQQEEWKLKQKAASKEDDVRAEEWIKQREIEQQKAVQAKKVLKEQKDKLSEAMGRRTHAISVEKVNNMDFLTDLLVDERQAKEEMKAKRDQERQLRERVLAREELTRIREEKERQKQELKRQNDECYQEFLRLLNERDKVQSLEDEKKRRKKEEHRTALQNALDEKKRLRAKEMKKLLMIEKFEIEDWTRREALVELERREMLKEHAPALKGFLPPGLIRPSDREFLSL